MSEQIKVSIQLPGKAPETFTMPEETPSSSYTEELSTYLSGWLAPYRFSIRLSRNKPKEEKTS